MTASPRLLEARAFAAPRQQDKFTSWAEAVVAVGKHLYRDEWELSEKARSKYLPYDRLADIEAEVSKRFPAPAALKPAPSFGATSKAGKPVDPDLMARLREAAARRSAERSEYATAIGASLPPYAELAAINDGRKSRLLAAQSKLFGAVINRQIPAHWYADGSANEPRSLPSGELVKEWNSTGGGNLTRRGYIWRDRAAWYVYLDTAKLAEIFPMNVQPKDVAPDDVDPADLSEYMQLALYVARIGYGARYKGLKDDIATQLVENAPRFGLGDGRLTDKIADQIATILRNKEAQGGKAGPLRAGNKKN